MSKPQIEIRRLTSEAHAQSEGLAAILVDYARLGWIPGSALFPDGRPCDTTVFWRAL